MSVGALYLEDSLRPHTQRFLILSKNLDNEGNSLKNSEDSAGFSAKGSDSLGGSQSTGTPRKEILSSRRTSGFTDEEKKNNSYEKKVFATLSVVQIFDSLSPYKQEMDLSLKTAFKKNSINGKGSEITSGRSSEKGYDNNNGNNDNINNNNKNNNNNDNNNNDDNNNDNKRIMERELDEVLVINTIGLHISLDANAVKHVHIILDPIIACLLASPVRREPGPNPHTGLSLNLHPPKGDNGEDGTVTQSRRQVSHFILFYLITYRIIVSSLMKSYSV